MLPAREVISPKQIHKIPYFLLRDAEVLASMVPEPIQIPTHVLLGPDHVTRVVIEEEVYQPPFWICLSAQKCKLAVLSPLAGSQPDLPACRTKDHATANGAPAGE